MGDDFAIKRSSAALRDRDHSVRMASRNSLPMLRSAKMVCQSGEYFCIIRDLSSLGIGLRFRHDVPPEARVILQLENDATYPIERVWAGKQGAGYRFIGEIDVDEFTRAPSPYHHRPIRLRIDAKVEMVADNLSGPARLIDLSRAGAMIETSRQLTTGSRVRLELPGLAPRIADICWRKTALYGLSFGNPISIDELAQTTLVLQPFASMVAPPVRRGPERSAA